MPEREDNNELTKLAAEGVKFKVVKGDNGYPLIRATMPPPKQVLVPEDMVCGGCQKQGCIVVENEKHSFARTGVSIEIEGVRRIKVDGCELGSMNADEFRVLEDQYIKSVDSPETRLFDECIEGKFISDINTGRIVQAVVNTLGEHDVKVRPPALSRIRAALSTNRNP
ncbi:hypothetical protein HYT74_00385 [Candidatus Daviesbacteria bacterium]|nr:hypothetical protein [Candidatus Daviesbacteria bacterium]